VSVTRPQKQQQYSLVFGPVRTGEARTPVAGEAEALAAGRPPESPVSTERLMEEICEADNLKAAYRRVKQNDGGPGVDGMTVDELLPHLARHWPTIREQLLAGTYEPEPVRRSEIEKTGGGVRKLGIPTVLDRVVQQAVLQVLQPRWDPTFSEHSYGFRPRRSARQAVAQAQRFIREGRRWVVDLDLEKFFDRVNHDRLMARVAERVKDKRLLRLLRAFLSAGVMEAGLVSPTTEGTPQGGPLSPLLSNLVLDELDRELERRGHRFARYADDCNIYVRSERAGQRVMASVRRYLTEKLRLKVNEAKSAVARPWERKFLGFSFLDTPDATRVIAPKSIERFKERVRELTQRGRSLSLTQRVEALSRYLIGWRGYYGFCETPRFLRSLDGWIRRRLRCAVWKHWKHGKRRFAELVKRGVNRDLAARTAGSARGPWHLSNSEALHRAFSNASFDALGLPRVAARRTP
jgi:RNA-directed DNA polymerase